MKAKGELSQYKNIKLIREKKILLDYSNEKYEIGFHLIELLEELNEKVIFIYAKKENVIVDSIYELKIKYEEFKKSNPVLSNLHTSIQNVYFFIMHSIKNNYIKIQELTSFELILFITTDSIVFDENGSSECLSLKLNLKKKRCDINDTTKMLCENATKNDKIMIKINEDNKILKEETNKLNKENKAMREEINKLKEENKKSKKELNNLREKSNKQISDLKEENKKLNEKIEDISKTVIFKMNNKIFENESEINLIKNRLLQIQGYENKKISFRLIYRMSSNGSTINDFRNCCVNISNLIMLIKTTENERFGGFIQIVLNSNNTNKNDNNSFCFSLTKEKIFNKVLNTYAVYDHSSYGPYFYDNFCFTNSNLNKGNCLNNNNSYYTGASKAFEINNFNQYFTAQEIEVFQVIFEQ